MGPPPFLLWTWDLNLRNESSRTDHWLGAVKMALSISFISPIAATPQPRLRETLDRDQAEKKPTARPKKTRENEVSLGKAEPLQVLEVEKKVAGKTQREQKEARDWT